MCPGKRISDNRDICSYCGNLDHSYAQCPQREEQREVLRKEREKNRKNKKKGKTKVKIVSGILTRQRDSDTATPSETFDPPLANQLGHLVCSFCGNATHRYTECPVLHQYTRQQADELATARARGYYPPLRYP